MRPRILLTVVILTALSLYAVVYAQSSPSDSTIPHEEGLYIPFVSRDIPPTPLPTPTYISGDTQPPTLVTWSFNPTINIEAITDPEIVLPPLYFEARFTDDLSGVGTNKFNEVNFADAYFISPSGHQGAVMLFSPYDLISGNAQDGVYRSQLPLLPSAEAGEWLLERLDLEDKAGNVIHLTKDDIAARGLPVSFQVINPNPQPFPMLSGN